MARVSQDVFNLNRYDLDIDDLTKSRRNSLVIESKVPTLVIYRPTLPISTMRSSLWDPISSLWDEILQRSFVPTVGWSYKSIISLKLLINHVTRTKFHAAWHFYHLKTNNSISLIYICYTWSLLFIILPWINRIWQLWVNSCQTQ